MAKELNGSARKRSGGRKKSGPKAVDGGEATGVEALRGNGYDPEMTREFVDSIEETQASIDEIMQKAKDKCAPLREDIAGIKKDAADKGLPRLELNAVLRKRRLLRKAEEVRALLSDEQADNLDQLEQALGMLKDTPLGRAAMGQDSASA